MFPSPITIANEHDLSAFDCGKTALNEFLVKYALTNNNAGIARTYVVTLPNQPSVIAYYSIAAGSVEREKASDRAAKGVPRSPVPVALIARLAVDLKCQRKGLGAGMLKHALQQILNASNTIGIRAVLVHAKDDEAAKFYRGYGFEPTPVNALHLMLLLKDVKKTLGITAAQT